MTWKLLSLGKGRFNGNVPLEHSHLRGCAGCGCYKSLQTRSPSVPAHQNHTQDDHLDRCEAPLTCTLQRESAGRAAEPKRDCAALIYLSGEKPGPRAEGIRKERL